MTSDPVIRKKKYYFFLNSTEGRASSCLESSPANLLSAVLRQIAARPTFIRPECSVNNSTKEIGGLRMEGTTAMCRSSPSTNPVHIRAKNPKPRSSTNSSSSSSTGFNIQTKHWHLFTVFVDVLHSCVKISVQRQTVSRRWTSPIQEVNAAQSRKWKWPIQDVHTANPGSECNPAPIRQSSSSRPKWL